MCAAKPSIYIEKARSTIAGHLRSLRRERGWSQAELARQLDTSQSRLSEIEQGRGSLSAEQFLLLLKIFNASPSDFVPDSQDPEVEIQNALARLGASHLFENENAVAAAVDDLVRVGRDALLIGSPRLVTALAPVLLQQAHAVSLQLLQTELARLGLPRRVPWLVENTLSALNALRQRPGSDADVWAKLVRRTAPLKLFLEYVADDHPGKNARPDILDPAIRTKRTADDVARHGSAISHRWNVITSLQPEDFVGAIRSALGPG